MKNIMSSKIILGIETSCDETAVSIVECSEHAKQPFFVTHSSIISSQVKNHAKYGGVVPELAARMHTQNISKVTKIALKKSKIQLKQISHIAVTAGPGLIPALVVGVEFAKGLASSLNVPLMRTNHMTGHLYSFLTTNPENLQFPIVCLVVSGGHTQIWLIESYSKYKLLGETVDDAIGEAFDKVAKLMNLPYPGGPQIEKLAQNGKLDIDLPRPMINTTDYNFSFSGLKTAARIYIEKNYKNGLSDQDKADVAMSFQSAAFEVLIKKTKKAALEFKAKTITLGGGVSASPTLRTLLSQAAEELSCRFIEPPRAISTDNAEMIAIASYLQIRSRAKITKTEKIFADPNWELS